nr:MAG: putative E1B 19 kDa protein [unidentified adenovirus]
MDASLMFTELRALREILKAASNRASWWDLLWASNFAKLIRRVKFEKADVFDALIDQTEFLDRKLLELLSDGYTIGIKHVIYTELDFSTPGRVVASMAFLAHVIDVWSADCCFTPDFVLDSVAVPLWQMIKYSQQVRELTGEEEKGGEEETEK